MTDRPVSFLPSAYVRFAEDYLRKHPELGDPETAWGRCLIAAKDFAAGAAGALGQPLVLIRVTGQTYPGREHWAATAFHADRPEQSTVLDLTARQFDPAADWPWVGSLNDFYDAAVDWLNDHIVVEVYLDPQDHPVWTDDYARDEHDPGDVWSPWGRGEQ